MCRRSVPSSNTALPAAAAIFIAVADVTSLATFTVSVLEPVLDNVPVNTPVVSKVAVMVSAVNLDKSAA